MSKLLKKLERVSRGEATPVGFATGRREKVAPLLLVALIASTDASAVTQAAKDGADAVLVSEESTPGDVAKLAEAAEETPWGVWLEKPEAGDTERLKEAGCDFMVFKVETAPAALLAVEEPGIVLIAPPSLADTQARAINLLPIEAVMLGEEAKGVSSSPLTVQNILDILRLKALVSKPVLVTAGPDITAEELQSLRDAGVEAVAVADGGPGIASLRGLIENLKPPRKRRGSKLEAFLPFGREVAPAAEDEEEES